MSNRALIIFVRRPVLGQVKTRIAKDAGEEIALRIYIELLRHTRDIAKQVECDRLLFYTDQIDHEDSWDNTQFKKYVQSSGDLGDRMKSAFRTALNTHDQAIIIGSDCAQLTADHIERAFGALDTHDTVIGPSMDGGYYLLGMRELHESLFDDMEWSVDSVCTETLSRISTAQLTHATIETLSDIDHWSDWEQYGWALT